MTQPQRDEFLIRLLRVVQWAQNKPYAFTYALKVFGESLVTEYYDITTRDAEKEIMREGHNTFYTTPLRDVAARGLHLLTWGDVQRYPSVENQLLADYGDILTSPNQESQS